MICVPDLTWKTFLVSGSRWRFSSTCIFGRNPLKLATDFDTLLLMNNSVVKHARDMSAKITLRRVGVQYDTAVLQQLFGKRLPLDFPKGTGTRCSKLGQDWAQTMKYQRVCSASLDKAAPLFPLHLLVGHLLVKSGLVGFYISPLLVCTKADQFFLLQDPSFT